MTEYRGRCTVARILPGGQAITANGDRITKVELWPIDVPITDPFVVATGRLVTAENIVVRITLRSGARGYGEIAPFPEVGGEDRASCLRIGTELARDIIGQAASGYGRIAALFGERAAAHPAARCGLEIALLDAVSRHRGVPLWEFWGGADVRERETDITIPIAELDRTIVLARGSYVRGFRLFKMKVGLDVDQDIRRLEAVHRAFSDIAFIVDANQGFQYEQCRFLVKEVTRFGGRIVLLEQPVRGEELESMAALRRDARVPVAADESVRTLQDAKVVLEKEAADFINIKIMKSGVIEAMEIAAFARAAGLGLMIGGMVETRIAMGCSFALALGAGGFEYLDLDTPLLLAADPVKGGYRYEGPRLVPWAGPGLDLTAERGEEVTTIE